MVSRDRSRIRDVKEQKPADDRVDRFGGAPRGDVAVHEIDVCYSDAFGPVTRHGERLSRPFDAQDRSRGPDEFCCEPRDVAQTGPRSTTRIPAPRPAACRSSRVGRSISAA